MGSAARKLKDEDTVSIAKFANDALKKAKNDKDAAVAILEKWAMSDTALYRALTEPLVKMACSDAINAVYRGQRRTILRRVYAEPPQEMQRERVVSMARTILGGLFDFPLPGGRALGLATAAEVAEAADFYLKQGETMTHNGRWLQLVRQSMTGTKPVMKQLTIDRLAELQKEAKNGK